MSEATPKTEVHRMDGLLARHDGCDHHEHDMRLLVHMLGAALLGGCGGGENVRATDAAVMDSRDARVSVVDSGIAVDAAALDGSMLLDAGPDSSTAEADVTDAGNDATDAGNEDEYVCPNPLWEAGTCCSLAPGQGCPPDLCCFTLAHICTASCLQ